jgi:hypothetical protein
MLPSVMETSITRIIILDIINGLECLQATMFWKLVPPSSSIRGKKVATPLHPLAKASLN